MSRAVAITAAAALTGLIGYAVYFDYMRRNSPEFRRSIKKQHKQIKQAAEQRSKAEKERNSKLLRLALVEIQNEIPPSTPEQQEAYFQEQVAEGERLAALGPDQHVQSAKEFYRALRVYPQPVELLMIYQKVVPAPIFALVLELTSLTGGGPTASGAPAGGASVGPIPIPEPVAASVTDIDEGPAASDSPNSKSQGSGAEWERVSNEA